MKFRTRAKEIWATCFRTEMIGGGTSYDVYFKVKDKPSRPVHCGHYAATIVCRDGGEFYRVVDAIDPREHWEMDPGMEKWDAFKRLEAVAKRFELRLLKRAFPDELWGMRSLPALWAPWTLPSKSVNIKVRVRLPD